MESSVFEVNTSVTRKSCRVQAAARLAHRMRGVYVVLACLALTAGILFAIRSTKVEIAVAALAIAAVYALLAVPVDAARLYSSRHQAVNSVFLMFDQDGFRVATSVEDTRFAYDQIIRMEERSGYVILYIRHHTSLAFRREEVLGGRSGALKAYLEEKTGSAFRSHRR